MPAGSVPSVLTCSAAVLIAHAHLQCKEAGSWRHWDKDPLSLSVQGCSLIRLLSLQDPQSASVIMEDNINCKILLIDLQNIWYKPEYFLAILQFLTLRQSQSIYFCFLKHAMHSNCFSSLFLIPVFQVAVWVWCVTYWYIVFLYCLEASCS